MDFGEVTVVERFYSADVAIIDLSVPEQQNSLLYHLGVRESFGMKQNILTYNESSDDSALQLRLSCTNYILLTYKVNENKQCLVTEPNVNRLRTGSEESSNSLDSKQLLSVKLTKLIKEVEVQTK